MKIVFACSGPTLYTDAMSIDLTKSGWLQTVAVYAGSRPGNNPDFGDMADLLGRLLVSTGFTVVYGGGTAGLMGRLANAVRDVKGIITGFTLRFFRAAQGHSPEGTETIVAENMHIRKDLMTERVQAAVYLPGGIGTLDEAADLMVKNDLSNLFNEQVALIKPLIFVNCLIKPGSKKRFYDGFKLQLKTWIETGFIPEDRSNSIYFVNSVEEAVGLLVELNLKPPMTSADLSTKHAEATQVFVAKTPEHMMG